MRSARKGIILFLIMLLVLSTTIQGTASADSLAAVNPAADSAGKVESAQHWAQSSMDKWTRLGVLKGYEDGSFHPDQQVTRAELATMINRIFGYTRTSEQPFADVPKDAWYSNALSIAKEAGYYEGYPGNLAKATTPVSRQDAVTLIVKAFYLRAHAEVSATAYSDDASIRSYAREAIAALGDVVKGYPDGSFKPDKTMSRAEVAKVLDSLVSELYSTAGTFNGGKINNHAIISADGVTLKDAEISGNLYLSAGIGNGDATLEHSQVKGKTFVSGGGENSIHVNGTSLGNLEIQRPEGTVRIVFSENSTAGNITVNSPAVLVFDSAFDADQLTIASGANGTKIEGTGTIAEIIVLIDGVAFNGQILSKNTSYSLKDGKLTGMGAPTTPITTGNSSIGSGGSSSSGGSGGGSTGGPTGPSAKTIDLVDMNATAETRSLFQFLNESRENQVLFGHQHDTTVSIVGKDSNGSVISDVYNAVGDYPVVFGWDTLSLDGKENPPGVEGDYEASRISLSAAMKDAYEKGGIVTLSTHPYNPVTGGDFKDTSNTEGAVQSVVTRILPGGDKNAEFTQYLDRIASFANQLKDDNGKAIPVIFRPFHEQNGSWFWWGAATTTKSEYIELYRYTVEYLRDVKGVRNFLYAYSPNGSFNGNEEQYLATYPGDEFVDILGMDQYDDKENAGSESFLKGLVKDLGMITKIADRKGKIATFSEYGYSAAGMKTTGNNELQWFTKVLNAIKADPDAKRISYMLTWANFGEGNNLFVPYKDAPGKGSHELLPDFIDYYNDPYTTFIEDLKNQNVYNREIAAASEKPFMHIVSPTNIGTVTDANAVIRAKVSHFQPSKVTFAIGAQGTEIEMKLGEDGYYSAVWSPDTSLNGSKADIIVRAYRGANAQLEQSISVFVKVQEILIKQFTFDTPGTVDQIQNNGTYSDKATIKMELGHSVIDGNGKMEIGVSEGLIATDTWQELKMELKADALEGVHLPDVKKVKFNALIPVSAQNDEENAAIRAVVQLPPDWSVSGKYGMNTTYKKLSDLEQVEISGVQYYKYDVVIELDNPEKSAEATGIAISLVGSGLVSQDGLSIYVDDLQLYNAYSAPVLDPALVDDFESYDGSSEALASKYPKAGGDDVSVQLTSTHKLSGDYGMKLQYAIDSQQYTGVGKSLGTVNWSGNNALHLWISSDDLNDYSAAGNPLKLVIQVRINGTAYEACPTINAGTSNELIIPFKDFAVASWSSGGPISVDSLKKVTNFNIYINSYDGGKHSGTLYFDDIRAINDSSLPALPGGIAGHAPGILYEFKSESDVAGWENNSNHTVAFNVGEQALSTEFPSDKSELRITPNNLNLTGLDTIQARVKLASGTAIAKLYIQTGSDWKWVDSGAQAINANEYTTLSISLPDAAAIKGTDLTLVQRVGIEIVGGGTLLLKDVTLTAPAGEPIEYLFDDNIDGWRFDEYETTGSVTKAVYDYNGNSLDVLKVDFSWTADKEYPYSATDLMKNLDLSTYSKMVIKVRVDSEVPGIGVKSFIKTTSNWTSHYGEYYSLDEDGFTTVILDFADIPAEDLKETVAIGLQFATPGYTTGTATAYIDEVKVLP